MQIDRASQGALKDRPETVEPILKVENLQVEFATGRGRFQAVAGVSFELFRGETLGLVGESGSGKSVTCLSLLRMIPPSAGRITGGRIELNGRDILTVSEGDLHKIRGREICMIMQDPMTSLDPLFTVGEQVKESLSEETGPRAANAPSTGGSGLSRAGERVVKLLELVRIPAARTRTKSYPHQLSGGMRQRVVAAIALSSEPQVLLADEPTTSLDVTIQVQFLDLLKSLQAERNLAMILVTHDLSIIARSCDRVAVMYAGRIVETATTLDLFDGPHHPYTRALLASVPRLGEFPETLPTIDGQPPDPLALPPGCPFHPRCAFAADICREQAPPMQRLGPKHTALCWIEPGATAVAADAGRSAATAAGGEEVAS